MRKLLYAAIFTVLIAAFCGKALAVKPTTLNELIDKAYTYNHNIIYSSEAAKIDSANIDIRNLLPPPSIEMEWRSVPVGGINNPAGTEMIFSQTIPFPTKLYQKWSILNQQAQTSKYTHELYKIKVLKNVKQGYYQYILYDKLAKLEYDNYRFLDLLYKSELKNYELGYSTQIDLIDTKTKLINSSATCQEYLTNKYNAFALLESVNASPNPRALMTQGLRGFMEDLPVLYYDEKEIDNIPHISKPMEELKNIAIANNPAYLKLKYESDMASTAAKIDESNYLPDITLGVGQLDSYDLRAMMPEKRFSVTMSLPWLWGGGVDNGNSYKKALFKYAEYYMAYDEMASNIDTKSNSSSTLYRKLNEYQPLLSLIDKQMNQVNLNYSTRYDEPKALESTYNQFQKVNNTKKNYYEIYLKYIDLIINLEELTGERLW